MARFGYRKILVVWLAAILLGGCFAFAWSWPLFRLQPDADLVLGVSLLSEEGWRASMREWFFEAGGWDGVLTFLALQQAVVLWVICSLLLGGIFTGVVWYFPREAVKGLIGGLAAAVLVVSVGKAGMTLWRKPVFLSEQVRLPGAALDRAAETAGDAPLFLNARAMLLSRALGREPDELAEEWAGSVGDPRQWRALDREHRFGAVFFIGRSNEYQPLLDHLLQSPDWGLAWVDAHGICFKRGAGTAWTPPEPGIELSQEEALELSMTAQNLAAAGLNGPARKAFNAAALAAPDLPEVAARRASFFAARGQWTEALDEAERASALRRNYPPAIQIQVQALMETRRPLEAWRAAEQLISFSPDDPYSLFLHARAANAVRAHYAEEKSLVRLIELSETYGLPVEAYRIYLGQCYARQGLAGPALAQLDQVLNSEHLNEDQRRLLQETRDAVAGQSILPVEAVEQTPEPTPEGAGAM